MSTYKERNTWKPQEFAKILGVSVKTLQRWDREGTLIAYRTPTNRRYYTSDHFKTSCLSLRFSSGTLETANIKMVLLLRWLIKGGISLIISTEDGRRNVLLLLKMLTFLPDNTPVYLPNDIFTQRLKYMYPQKEFIDINSNSPNSAVKKCMYMEEQEKFAPQDLDESSQIFTRCKFEDVENIIKALPVNCIAELKISSSIYKRELLVHRMDNNSMNTLTICVEDKGNLNIPNQIQNILPEILFDNLSDTEKKIFEEDMAIITESINEYE